MFRYSAHDAKQNFGQVIAAARQVPVFIRKYKRDVAVVISARRYDELLRMERQVFKIELADILHELEQTNGIETDFASRRLARLVSRMPEDVRN